MSIGEAREAQKAAKRVALKQAAAEREAAARRRNAFTGMIVAVVAIGAVVGLLALLGAFSAKTPAALDSQASPGAVATDQPAADPPAPKVEVPPALAKKPEVTKGDAATLTKLDVKTLIQGTGPAVVAKQQITVNYVGVFYKDGKEFDSSWSRNEPATFQIGNQKVIPGWDQGLVGVKVGSRVLIDIPSALAYGADEAAATAAGKPAGPLRFVVDVLAAQ
ncbi:peptidylprolyl isomerase [Allocatelliglobosispora scoriae]|uniref:Peptidyl-prolyl cis-trans isomerase n=1 Tax=Allocatelliglobosispora scoriae TaxID=643052 RepID=A0A841C3Z5_9ACTN|nr:FKBP-type peptidyl-prolyl cis-trans isomerase [Allocatelliglobosispora scoriae]MBB5873782.1 peptidylprolyl isomerase [Allocatelliglobosispora scoriae]